MTLRPCEPITRVAWDGFIGRPCLFFDRTIDIGASWFTVEGLGHSLAAEVEGVVWIRGHHLENSDEGQALLAAYALARGHAA